MPAAAATLQAEARRSRRTPSPSLRSRHRSLAHQASDDGAVGDGHPSGELERASRQCLHGTTSAIATGASGAPCAKHHGRAPAGVTRLGRDPRRRRNCADEGTSGARSCGPTWGCTIARGRGREAPQSTTQNLALSSRSSEHWTAAQKLRPDGNICARIVAHIRQTSEQQLKSHGKFQRRRFARSADVPQRPVVVGFGVRLTPVLYLDVHKCRSIFPISPVALQTGTTGNGCGLHAGRQ